MIGKCGGCERDFASLVAFDAHQSWDYAKPPGDQLTCADPATVLDRHGKPRFRINSRGRWGSADEKPSGAWTVTRETAEQPHAHTSTPTVPCAHCGPITPALAQLRPGPHLHGDRRRHLPPHRRRRLAPGPPVTPRAGRVHRPTRTRTQAPHHPHPTAGDLVSKQLCEGPLIWYDAGDSAILECARPTCDYVIVSGNFHDERHRDVPVLREGLAT
jgi:hypothetical protein